jgi:transposase
MVCVVQLDMPLPPAPPLHIRPADRRELMMLVTKPTAPQRAVRRALVLLDAANGVSNAEISRKTKMAREHIIALRRRFEERGLESVYHDADGRGRPREISEAKVAKIITTTMQTLPKNATHWTADEMAKRFHVSSSTIYRLWRAHNLQPHRVTNFKFSTDPDFVTKLRDIVGLYMNPPTNAIVLSVDEKSGVQALERTAPILPLREGVPARQTHDYRRNGTTTLFAALNTLTGAVIERCLPRHRHEEFVQFLDEIDRSMPKNLAVHLIMDNYATHKHADVKAWLAEHPRYHVHFTPTSSSWLNAVERFFAEITARRIRRGTFTSVAALKRAITAYVRDHNKTAEPFVWTKSARTIMRKINKCHAIYGGSH